jgi:hypothetical protein
MKFNKQLFYSHLYKNIIELQFVLLTVPLNAPNTIQKHISLCLASSLISLGTGNFKWWLNVSSWEHSMCLEMLLLWESLPLSSLLSSSHSIRILNFVQLILYASCMMSNSNLYNLLIKRWKLNTVDISFPSYMFWYSVQSARTSSVRTLHLSGLWVGVLDDHRPTGENFWTSQHNVDL